MLARGKSLFWPVVGLALLLTALQPLLAGVLPWRGDGSLHFYRLPELELAAAAGAWFPRWAPDLGYGYGFPLFHYYAPLSYQVLLPLRALGLSTGAAYLVGYGAALALTAGGLAAWFRSLDDTSPVAALVPLAAAGYAPYLLYNLYFRGAYAEVWGLAWLSLGLWTVRRAARTGGRRSTAALALTTAGLMLSHNVTALVGLPLLLGYGMIESTFSAGETSPGRFRRPVSVLSGVLLGLALAAFFWLPALLDRDLIRLDRLVDGANFNFRAHFLALSDLLALPPRIDPRQVNPTLPLSLSWPALAAAAASWWPRGRPLAPGLRRPRLWFTLALAGLLLLTLPISEPLWDTAPLLALVQFPWRLLGPASLCLAVLAGLGLTRLGRRAVPAFVLLCVGWGLAWLSPPRYAIPADPAPADLIRFEAQTGFLGTTSAGDFLPATVEALPAPDSLLPAYDAAAPSPLIPRLAEVPADLVVLEQAEGWNDSRYRVTSPTPAPVVFRRFAFPGWALTVDGAPWPWRATDSAGLIGAELPAGAHDVRLAFGTTPLWRAAGVLAALAGLVVAGLLLWPGPQPAGQRTPTREPAAGEWRWGGWLLALGAALALFKAGVLDQVAQPLRPERFDGASVAGSERALSANFGGELRLVGADLPAGPVPADEPLPLTLYWTAGAAGRELSVSIQLVDDQGRRFGQSDNQHPANYPVTRWAPGEYGVDRHALRPLAGTPPGDYALWLQVYDPGSGRLVELLDAAGRPLDVRLPLGSVTVARPGAPAAPPALTPLPLRRLDPGDGIALLQAGSLPPRVGAGEALPLLLFWEVEQQPVQTAEALLQLIDASGAVSAAARRVPVGATFPPERWQAGDRWRDEVLLPVPPVTTEGAPLAAGRYRVALTLLDAAQRPLGPAVDLGQIDITVPERTMTPPAVAPLGIPLGDVGALTGYALGAQALAAGDTLEVTLVWESLALTGRSYTVFVQLLRDGRIVAQQDRLPANGARPTSGWLPGEFVTDRYDLVIPPGTPAGPLALVVGLYDATTSERLRTPDGRDAIAIPGSLTVLEAAP